MAGEQRCTVSHPALMRAHLRPCHPLPSPGHSHATLHPSHPRAHLLLVRRGLGGLSSALRLLKSIPQLALRAQQAPRVGHRRRPRLLQHLGPLALGGHQALGRRAVLLRRLQLRGQRGAALLGARRRRAGRRQGRLERRQRLGGAGRARGWTG